MSKTTLTTIKIPGDEFPFNNCEILEGSLKEMGKETSVFTTVSKAGNKRKITIYPNGGREEVPMGHVET